MRLPSLSIIIVSQLVIWCIAGVAVHGLKILLYPASWLVIGTAFYFHNQKNPITQMNSDAPPQKWANSSSTSNRRVEDSAQGDAATPPHVAASE